MKAAGFFLLVAGWLLVLAALIMLRSINAQTAFVLAGLAVEVLGLVLAVRAHLAPRPDRR
jgi:VIT1/CCC1 family predicted Fe2+/Mn2+ transporter